MSNPIYALVLGVSDYRAYDPSGRADLPGANNDADRWSRILTTQFGLPDDQVRQQSGLTDVVDTDRAAIVAGLKWLGLQLAKSADSSALLAFSGHGLTVEGSGDNDFPEGLSLALAPSDITPTFEAALTFNHIEEILFTAIGEAMFGDSWAASAEQSAPVEARMGNITAVLDACYSRPETTDGTPRTLTAVQRSTLAPVPRLFTRLTLACQLWEVAYEIQTAGNWHGAFTYALTSMMEQWQTGTDTETAVTYLTASYGDLMFRARTLINTLGLEDQNPALVGTANNLALVPFLRPTTDIAPGRTSVAPNGVRRREEFSAGNDSFWESIQILTGGALPGGACLLQGLLIGNTASIPSSWQAQIPSGFPAQSITNGYNYWGYFKGATFSLNHPNWYFWVSPTPGQGQITSNSPLPSPVNKIATAHQNIAAANSATWTEVMDQIQPGYTYNDQTYTTALLTPQLMETNPSWCIRLQFNATEKNNVITVDALSSATVYATGVGNQSGVGQAVIPQLYMKGPLSQAPAIQPGDGWWSTTIPF